jgi:hypothetical protein
MVNYANFTKTDERIQYDNREAIVYKGKRGAKYIKIKGEYINMRDLKISGGRPRRIPAIPDNIIHHPPSLPPPKNGRNWLGTLENHYGHKSWPENKLLDELIDEWYNKNKTKEDRNFSITNDIYPFRIFDGYIWQLKLRNSLHLGIIWILYCQALDDSIKPFEIANTNYDKYL